MGTPPSSQQSPNTKNSRNLVRTRKKCLQIPGDVQGCFCRLASRHLVKHLTRTPPKRNLRLGAGAPLGFMAICREAGHTIIGHTCDIHYSHEAKPHAPAPQTTSLDVVVDLLCIALIFGNLAFLHDLPQSKFMPWMLRDAHSCLCRRLCQNWNTLKMRTLGCVRLNEKGPSWANWALGTPTF